MDIHLRDMRDEDTSLVFNSWLKSYRSQTEGRAMTNTTFYEGHTKVIDKILGSAAVKLAVDPEDTNEVYGFICYQGDILHYAYTKHRYRGLGILSYLLESVGGRSKFTTVTHLPRNWGEVSRKYNIIFNPYRR